MTDVLTPEQRRRCMSKNKGRDTGPELKLRKQLWHEGYRYRLNYNLTGKPDITFPANKVAIFVDGSFWHGCPLHSKIPKTNTDFWKHKIEKNIQREEEVNELLRQNGWEVIRFWEHEIKADLNTCINHIKTVVKNSRMPSA